MARQGYRELPHGRIGPQLGLWGSEPWEGVAPRVLTAGYLKGIFKAQAEKSVSDFVDPNQYDLWLPVKKAPWKYQGAPSLRPLQEER